MPASKETIEKFKRICDELETSKFGVRSLCGKSNKTINYSMFKLLITPSSDYYESDCLAYYTRAKSEQCDYWASQLLTLSEQMEEDLKKARINGENVNAIVQTFRIKMDNIKWLLSKLAPRKYGDRTQIELQGQDPNEPAAPIIIQSTSDINVKSVPTEVLEALLKSQING